MAAPRDSRRRSRRLRSLTARLLAPLIVVVGGVMGAFALWSMVQRERTMVAEARRETQAYATALGLALDAAFRDPDQSGVPELVNRISREPTVYGVVVYGLAGRPLFGPGAAAAGADYATPEEVRGVLASGATTEFERTEEDVPVYSVVRPIRDDDGRIVGAFEVLQPLSGARLESTRTRTRFVLNTIVLMAAVSGLLVWLVRRLVSEPLARFAGGVRRLGAGHLDHRLDPNLAITELASVAAELNRMAAGLESAQAELVKSTEARVVLEGQVRRAEKMAMVGQLAAALAHEIGAPLQVIRGRADRLSVGGTRSEREARDLAIIVEQIDRITRIVRNLLDFSRHEEPDVGSVDLVPLVDGVLELVSVDLEMKGVEARRSGAGRAVVLGDADQLQQVVLNLVMNASQALAEADGPRTIDVRVSGLPEQDEIVLEVVDSGPGIPVEHRERIFDPFFTTRSGQAGTGLGLAVARWIVEDHHGRLVVAPNEGPGATLAIHLPIPTGPDHGR